MRNGFLLLGAVLLIGGGYVLLEGGSITSREDVLNVGGLQVSAKTRHPILPWMAWVGVLAGGAFVVAGLNRKA